MTPLMGVAIVAYNGTDQILACLETLLAAQDADRMRIVIVDNASTDGTAQAIRDWAAGRRFVRWPLSSPIPPSRISKPVSLHDGYPDRLIDLLTLIENPANLGFAAGVNRALEILRSDPQIDRMWILNPDCLVPRTTPKKLMQKTGEFGLLGTRMIYAEDPDRIQIDLGRIDRKTGRTHNTNLGQPVHTPAPDPQTADFICGASMLVSRGFLTQAGPMPERYFLYYEEVDWARRRGSLPLSFCAEASVYHVAGGSIGSPTLSRGPSNLSHYYKHRSRMMFMRRYYPNALPFAVAFGLGKAGQALLRQGPSAGWAVLSGLLSGLAQGRRPSRPRPQATAVATADKSP